MELFLLIRMLDEGGAWTGHMARAEQQTLADVVDGFLDTNVAALYEQFLDSCLSPSKNDTGTSIGFSLSYRFVLGQGALGM